MSGGTKCRTCGVAHNFHPEHGWRADNGKGLHPYDKRTEATIRIEQNAARTTPLRVAHANPAPASTPADYEILFGQWAFCRTCGSGTAFTAAGMEGHRRLHADLDQLRADVDRLMRRSS